MEKIKNNIPHKVLTRFAKSDILIIVPQYVTERSKNLNTKEIGNKLIELRGSRTQEEVASAINISSSALSMYERGERIPRDPIKVKLAKYYKKTVQNIFFT